MIVPSAINVIAIGLSMVIFTFLWRMLAVYLVQRRGKDSIGGAMAVAL